MKKLLTLTALGAVLACSDASASGFYLKEQSAAAQGNAYAGATAGAEDISYSYFNPAGLTRHSGTNIQIGGTWISPNSTHAMHLTIMATATAIWAILFIRQPLQTPIFHTKLTKNGQLPFL